MKIIDFLKQKISEAGTQTAVARKTGVSQGTIAKALSGDTTLDLGTLLKIARAYGISVSEFDEAESYPHGTDKFKQFAEAATQQQPDQPSSVYFPEVKWAADWMQIKITGKTPEERMKQIEEMMDVLRKEFK